MAIEKYRHRIGGSNSSIICTSSSNSNSALLNPVGETKMGGATSLIATNIINSVDTNITADTNTIKGDTMEKKTGATGIKNTIEKDSILQFESSSSSSPSSQKNYSEKQNNMSSNSATGSSLAMSLSANFNLHPNQRRF